MSEPEHLVSFKQLIDDRLTARIAVQREGEWVDRSKVTVDEDIEYIVGVGDSGQSRYRLSTEEGNEEVEGWSRFVFPIKRKIKSGEEDEVESNLEIIIEITEAGSVPGSIPWDKEDEFRVPSKLLGSDSELEPVSAGRVAGLEKEKDRLERFLEEAEEDWNLSESTGIILEGPPGTGKTELVMEACQEKYGSIPVMISGPQILSKWVGESERMLREKFEEARNTDHKVLYIDELDAIAQSRSEVSESYSAQIVSQLLVLLDGVESKVQSEDMNRSLRVVASTNLSHVVDPALRRPGRLGNRPIQFGRPDSAGRKAILHHYLENVYVSSDGRLSSDLEAFVEGKNLEYLNGIIEDTEGFTGADIEDVIQEAVSQLPESSYDKLSREYLENVIEDGDFKAGQDFSEKELTQSHLQNEVDQEETTHSDSDSDVHYLEEGENAEKVASQYLRSVDQSSRELTYKFRTISPKDILDSDSARAQENTVQAFQHRENERIALYLKNADRLLQAKESSSLVDRLIGVLNEQFLQWEDENLLILPESSSNLLDISQ